jgi:hypothetical protein
VPGGRVDANFAMFDGTATPDTLPDCGAAGEGALPAPNAGGQADVLVFWDPTTVSSQTAEVRLVSHIWIGTRDFPIAAEDQTLFGPGEASGVAGTFLVGQADPEDESATPGRGDPWTASGWSRLEIACPAHSRVLVVIGPILLSCVVSECRRSAASGTGEDC